VAAQLLPHVLLALVVIVVVARALGSAFRRLDQPAVIGEMVAGILLGPSLLGRISPRAAAFLLPSEVVSYLEVIAQVGVVLFIFLVGLELDAKVVRERPAASVAVSTVSIALPFGLGALLATHLHGDLAPAGVPVPVFALFLGVSMSVTAFPVLARILTDRRMQKTRLGVLALTCAAFNDVIAWCLLALVVGVAKAEPSRAAVTVALSVAFVAGMLLLVRPIVARLARSYDRARHDPRTALAAVLAGLLSCALLTDVIGIHPLFGAFAFGAIIPCDCDLAHDIEVRLTDVVVVLLLPVFFAFTGMRTELGLVHGADQWLVCALIVLVATTGKVGGAFVAARLAGIGRSEALSLGVLMNTRGLMELVALNVGLDLGVIGPTLFAMLVLMALVTTFATSPVLAIFLRQASEVEACVPGRGERGSSGTV
jgi:Kef-type K+ transport system membrane component KefB